MKTHKVNLKMLVVIGIVLLFFGFILIVIGSLTEKILHSIALNAIFGLGFLIFLLAIVLLLICVFKLRKKEQNEKEFSEREYISKHKNNASTLLRSLNYENETLHIPNAKSVYTYSESNGKYNIEVYIADKRFFITFYESYVEYYCVGIKEFFPEEKDIIKKKIQRMSLKEIEEFINIIIAEIVDKN